MVDRLKIERDEERHQLRTRIAELEAALHIATNDKLSLLDQLDQALQGRMAQIDYGCDLQRIIEDLCRGGPIREPKTSARHHYNMAREHLAAERLAGARVKPLDWVYDSHTSQWWANSAIGQYRVWEIHGHAFFNIGSSPSHAGGKSIEEAKATAQADFERRILSALAEPAGKVEPVAWRYRYNGKWYVCDSEAVARLGWDVTPLYATPPDASAIREALERLLAIAEKQKAYHNTKQHEFPSIEQCVDEDGKFSPASNLYKLLQGETYNGRYTEADWWVCTIRAEIAALAGAKP